MWRLITVKSGVTGKPSVWGSSLVRPEATIRVLMGATIAAMEKLKINPCKATCAVQGFGNVGSWAARLLYERGLVVQAISDISGAYYNEKGKHIPAPCQFR